GILAVAAVLGAPRGLDVRDAPGLGSERAQEGRRVEGAGPDLGGIGLLDDAAALGPEALERDHHLLERAPRIGPAGRRGRALRPRRPRAVSARGGLRTGGGLRVRSGLRGRRGPAGPHATISGLPEPDA